MATPKWPRDHKAKHAAAARKGWMKRNGLEGKAGVRQPRMSVRKHTYHGKAGYLISGTDAFGRHPSIFARTKSEAMRIRNAVKVGRDFSFDSQRKRR